MTAKSVERAERATADPAMAMSIREFCARHSISLSLFYVLRAKGKAPQTMRVGGRRLVSQEEAARWRAEQIVAA
jgi:predicted DNA-binding transcriptional regulator AlpA